MSTAAGFVDAVPLPALLIRQDERIEAANAQAAALLGPGLVGRHFITALRQPELLDAIEAALRDGAGRSATYLTSDGNSDACYEVSLRAVPMSGGHGLLVCFTDTTPLEAAGQIRRDFVANVSHELRTPLTSLLGFIETLRGPASGDGAARERFLGIMQTEAQRMNRLVDDLLSLSRVEAEARVRPRGQVDPAALLRSTGHSLMPLAQEAGVTLEVAVPEAVQMISGDPDQLRQVMTNLTENAIKYSGRGASVCLRLSAPEYEPRLRAEGVRITVEDTGPGIDPHHLPRLTERFYRVDSHRSREMGGTGLGLAIVKHIVGRHRGRLTVQSTPGQGSCFTVTLPVA